MEGGFEGVWPKGVATSLWNFDLLRPDEQRLLPLMGMRPDWSFLLAFAFGACVIAFFANQRFRQRTFDPSSFDYRVLRELAPTQLRGSGPVRRAYYYYAGTLIAIYSAMTFFGGLILQTVGSIPMAGLQVNVDNATLQSTQWPLTLALALAGFAPMIRPLEIVETWLRQRAHQWVGIPVRIKENTRRLLFHLEKIVDTSAKSEMEKVPQWAAAHVNETDSLYRVMLAHNELELLVRLIRDEDVWPAGKVRDELRRLKEEQTAEAEISLQSFDEILATDYSTSLPGGLRDATGSQGDLLKKHQRRLETKLSLSIQKIRKLRDEFGSIFTVFAERDKEFRNIQDMNLRAAMEKAFPIEKSPPGIDVSVLLMLFPILIIYVIMVSAGLHSLLTSVDKRALTIMATAGLETIRIAVIFWLPLLVVSLWQRRLRIHGRWAALGFNVSVQTAKQIIGAMVIASLVAFMGLSLLCILWMAIVSHNSGHFRELLFHGEFPAYPYFIGQAGAAPLFVLIVVWAADILKVRQRSLLPFLAGCLSALMVSAWMIAHRIYWIPKRCESASLFDCFRQYNLTDFLIYIMVALLSVVLIALRANTPGGVDGSSKGNSKGLSNVVAGAGAILACWSSGALAQTDVIKHSIDKSEQKVVVAGFRNDAEPFSYRVGQGERSQFKGYIADLCFKLFDGSKYSVVSVAVDAKDRFQRLRKKTDTNLDENVVERHGQEIDILCDPVTLRFSDPEMRADGIFSPIVFASGVSYILRRTRTPKSSAYLAYVADTTSATVAQRACEIDLLGVRGGSERHEKCTFASEGSRDCSTAKKPEVPTYIFCVMESHDELIKWFCRTEPGVENFQLAYFGDREIILAKLEIWIEQQGCPAAEIEREHPYFTYEPYALLVSKADPDLVQFVQRRVFEFFSHRREAIGLFATYFPNVQMSPTVANLFLLNRVVEDKFFKRTVETQTYPNINP